MSWWQILAIVGCVAAVIAVWRLDRDGFTVGMASLVAILVIALVIVIPIVIRDQEAWEAWCAKEGGRVDSTSHVIPAGKTVVVDEDYFCIGPDGQLLGVR